MNIATALSICGAKLQRALNGQTDAATEAAPETTAVKTETPARLAIVYRFNRSAIPTTCLCGVRFVAGAGIWPFASGSDRPVCMCCDSQATDTTSDSDLRRVAAQAEFTFDVPPEITMRTIAALRRNRTFQTNS